MHLYTWCTKPLENRKFEVKTDVLRRLGTFACYIEIYNIHVLLLATECHQILLRSRLDPHLYKFYAIILYNIYNIRK